MCKQKAVSDAYALATAALASETSCSFHLRLVNQRAYNVYRCVLDRDNNTPYINKF